MVKVRARARASTEAATLRRPRRPAPVNRALRHPCQAPPPRDPRPEATDTVRRESPPWLHRRASPAAGPVPVTDTGMGMRLRRRRRRAAPRPSPPAGRSPPRRHRLARARRRRWRRPRRLRRARRRRPSPRWPRLRPLRARRRPKLCLRLPSAPLVRAARRRRPRVMPATSAPRSGGRVAPAGRARAAVERHDRPRRRWPGP